MGWFSKIIGKKPTETREKISNIYFTNTLSGRKELFVPVRTGVVKMYSCGPTVYGPAHIGNLRAYIFSDTIARTLFSAGYRVIRVINITDVGHMTSDADEGVDKMSLGAKRENTTPEEIADRYTKEFFSDLADLNVDTSDIEFPRATKYIREQIALARTLEEKGFAYRITNGLAFDTSKYNGYGKLGNLDLSTQRVGARIEADKEKRHPSDFWLWRTAKPEDLQQWDSPWGRGNPGWHIECSAMSRAILGQEIDIHTGGEDHIAIHHNNEIAQSESSSGRKFVHFWMHGAFLTVEGEKISKSLGNDIYLRSLIDKGFHPLALRYFFLQAHYRTPLSFSWNALASAGSALDRLWTLSKQTAEESNRVEKKSDLIDRFNSFIRDDLGTPQALGVLWDAVRNDDYTPAQKMALISLADKTLGLMLMDPPNVSLKSSEIPDSVNEMLARRSAARQSRDFDTADSIRQEIENSGYHVEDGEQGPVLSRKVL